MTKLCNTCEYLRYCARSGIEDVGCDRYKRDTTTNEEWFCGLSTEEKAKVISKLDCYHGNVYEIEQWLKEVHK